MATASQRRRFRLRKKRRIVVEGSERTVQVGSFGEKANAQRLADRLQRAGIDAVDMDQAQVDGQHVWRVRIGPVGAEKLPGLLEQLRQLDLPNPRVFAE